MKMRNEYEENAKPVNLLNIVTSTPAHHPGNNWMWCDATCVRMVCGVMQQCVYGM